jgi:hypothetical protein
MTDLSSKPDDDNLSSTEMMMARDLMESKIREAKSSTKMTHLLMLGNFRMEIVPTNDINVKEIFKDTLTFLHEKYGDELLKGDLTEQRGHMHG